jgi:hypothetical protein
MEKLRSQRRQKEEQIIQRNSRNENDDNRLRFEEELEK